MRVGLSHLYVTIFSTTILLIACGKNSAGRNQINLVSDDEMNTMGEEAYADVLSKSKISRNRVLTSEVEGIGQRIARASGEDFNWEFALIDENSVNAFCLPGGKVAVYTGIVSVAENNAALAAVVGHEVAHATLRHASERMSQNLLLQTGLSLISVTFATSEYQSLIAAALGIGTTYGVELPFSRYHEAEADRLGLEYMARAGYDPREAIGLWQRMGEAGGGRPPEILSTHPDPINRAKDLEKHMGKALEIYQSSDVVPTYSLN